ncbi:HTH-type transcriptional regulator Lrp [Natrinema altunense]|uniref:Transcription regulator AsnC-type-like protein n=1 Tax=Natrinema altunense (strain JCM 12890 / CGMCC 1.3731 / AJ2) TaxID=1227494 RepID=L9ZIF7_NATA2|nr:HTH-type transcriptional regulator Lrp [Natrinema altunense]ELY85836.1 Transcription regulator AsnC-type-like protein [Natrinema altunense JCM 12890]
MTYEHLDSDLVNELLDDGRASLRSLAEELDVSVTTVSNHLSDLEDEGVIEGYTPKVDYDAVGYDVTAVHLSDLEDEGVIEGYTPKVDYDAVGYDVTAVMQFKAEGNALPEITETLKDHRQMISVYEVTGDYDVIAIGKFQDTDDMNDQIKTLITDPDINQSNTSIVLNSVSENEQFELDTE